MKKIFEGMKIGFETIIVFLCLPLVWVNDITNKYISDKKTAKKNIKRLIWNEIMLIIAVLMVIFTLIPLSDTI